MPSRKKLRPVHINGDEWKYVVRGDGHGGVYDVYIYSPRGTRHAIDVRTIWMSARGISKEEADAIYEGGISINHLLASVPPSEVKKFIEKNVDEDGRLVEASLTL
jgi:hypothetical protein